MNSLLLPNIPNDLPVVIIAPLPPRPVLLLRLENKFFVFFPVISLFFSFLKRESAGERKREILQKTNNDLEEEGIRTPVSLTHVWEGRTRVRVVGVLTTWYGVGPYPCHSGNRREGHSDEGLSVTHPLGSYNVRSVVPRDQGPNPPVTPRMWTVQWRTYVLSRRVDLTR